MKRKTVIVADSSANLFRSDYAGFMSVPLKILTDAKEYVDDEVLDVEGMLTDLREYKGRSGTSCPSVGDWLQAFGDAEEVYGVSLTSHLSGCYNAASIAAEDYMVEHQVERYSFWIPYSKRTHLLFSLESLANFARNGRVSPALAAANLLGIRIVGRASDEGELEPLHKCRGEKRAIRQLWDSMQQSGYAGGKVCIRHSDNLNAAEMLAKDIQNCFPNADIKIGVNRGLCSYYAEKGGILVGFESR